MEESVQCGECGNRYDSNEDAFCPRCGSLRQGRAVEAAVASAGRQDPVLRRVRAAGVVLMVLGVLALAQFTYMAVDPPEPDDAQLEALAALDWAAGQPGGDVSVHVLGDNATLRVVLPNGTVFREVEDATWLNATLPTAFANVTVARGNASQVHMVYAPPGTSVAFEVDATQAQEDPVWHAASTQTTVRVISGFLAFLALVVVAGGYGAWRTRLFGLAVTAGVVTVFPGLLVLPFVPLAGLLLMLPGMVALAFILAGRKTFRRP